MDYRPELTIGTVKPHSENVRSKKHLAIFTLANVGPVDVEITEIGTALIAEAKSELINPEKLRFERKNQPFILPRGQENVSISPSMFPELNLYYMEDKSWFCIGYITYRRIADGPEKTTGFCRKWDFEDLLWLPEPNEEFEY
jgi:hypothetical protein